ncbi:MAG: carboxylesterase/lipase family protein, partial [Succinivibrio sp.]
GFQEVFMVWVTHKDYSSLGKIAALILALSAAAAWAGGGPRAVTAQGALEGKMEDGVQAYLGVPYAKVVENFKPAAKADKWEGVRDAASYGRISYQSGIFGQKPKKAAPQESADPLNLNIWTPGADSKKRPVMVWLHGGGFSVGSANEDEYDGARLSSREDVVVVGVNHRLGVYGHLDLSACGSEWAESANVGMIDIVDALKWVRDNIASFGGDPGNVTLFGQSGGGAKVIAMMSSPKAAGLFRRGIIESGATDEMGRHFTKKNTSQAVAAAILKRLGIGPENLARLKDVSEEQLVNAAFEGQHDAAVEHRIPISIGKGYASEWEPVVDGLFLTDDPVGRNGFAKGAERYGMLIGSNLTEWNTIMPKELEHKDTVRLRSLYARAFPDQDPALARDFDSLLRLPIREVAASRADLGGQAVYSYVFTRSQGSKGVPHSAEIPYVFGHKDDDQWMSLAMMDLWGSYARTGVPSAQGIPEWEPYTRKSGAVMILDLHSYVAHHHDEALLRYIAPDRKF